MPGGCGAGHAGSVLGDGRTERTRRRVDLPHRTPRSLRSGPAASGYRYADFLASRPRGAENLAIAWLAERAAPAGLARKGRIAAGADADFCVFAPDEACVVDPARLQHRHPVTPHRGRALLGQVRQTWLRGEPVDLDVPRGELLVREQAPRM